jgi:hypothetical protein
MGNFEPKTIDTVNKCGSWLNASLLLGTTTSAAAAPSGLRMLQPPQPAPVHEVCCKLHVPNGPMAQPGGGAVLHARTAGVLHAQDGNRLLFPGGYPASSALSCGPLVWGTDAS